MRIRKLALAAAFGAAALLAGPARADPPPTVVVFGALRDAGRDRNATVTELERRLRAFRDAVRHYGGGREPPFGPFQVLDEEDLVRPPPNAMQPDGPVAVLWGRARRRQQPRPVLRPEATVFIGPLRVQHQLRSPTNAFETILGQVSLDDSREDTDVGAYVVIIGYALMLRIWPRDARAAGHIAQALQDALAAALRGRNNTSPCLADLNSAIKAIGGAARNGTSGSALVPPFVRTSGIDCNPPE